jgi:outer membrane protein TolC
MNSILCPKGLAVLAALVALGALPAGAEEPATRSLSLQDCMAYALQHNPDLVSSQQSVVVARSSLRQARSSYSPQLTLSASDSLHDESQGVAASTGGADLTLNMTFWRSGRQDSVGQSRASLSAATASHEDRRLTVARMVAEDYYAVLAAAELVGVARAGVESAEGHRKQVEKQIEQGSVAPVEIHTVDDDLAQARLSLIDAKSTVRTALATLKADMGMPYTNDLQLVPAIMGAAETLPATADAVATALATRPDIQAQQATVRARRHAVAVARAARGPVLEVAGQAAESYPDWNDTRSSVSLSAGLTWPLFDGGNTAAAQDAAAANLTSSEADLQALADQVTLEVQSALIGLESAAEKIRATDEAVIAATARLRSAEVKYQEGLGILLEVTDARQALTSAEADAVRARFSYQVGRIALQRAMGVLPLPTGEAAAQ